MTVVNAMKFNGTQGAIVTDEQSTDTSKGTTQNIAQKTHKLQTDNAVAVVGGTGASNVLKDIIDTAEVAIEQNSSKILEQEQLVNYLANVATNVRARYIDGFLINRFGLIREDFVRPIKPISPQIMQEYSQLMNNPNSELGFLKGAFIAVSYDKKNGVNIYNLDNDLAKPIPQSLPYASAGSGKIMADGELYALFKNMPRDKKTDINPVEGIASLLNATEEASNGALGVGGTPQIMVLDDGDVIVPGENESRLATEIAKATKENYLTQKFQQEALDELILNQGNFDDVERKMRKSAKKPRELYRFLRGYKPPQ
jgi:hypothetical protein